MRFSSIHCLVVLLLRTSWPTCAAGDSWPTLRHDERRSNVSSERLDCDRLALAWTHRVEQPPRPAWPGPARWDAYVQRAQIGSMRNYDESFHLTAAAGAIYFGSSADDAVHCLDAATGQERWRYTVGGPVRLPPTINQDRLYFGSDDGYVYCLSADGVKLHWKFRPAPPPLVLQDGRLISQWPVRTGVLVKDGLAYFGASLLPWEKSYIGALRADSGGVSGDGSYVQEVEHATLEGSILATARQLIFTQGRQAPLAISRSTGHSKGTLAGVLGGSFALVAMDGSGFFGPGPREGHLSEANPEMHSVITRKFGATAMVAGDGRLYVLERGVLGCIQQQPEQWLWRRPSDLEDSLIIAGDVLIAGGQDKVVAFDPKDGAPIWQAAVLGRAQSLAVADGALLVSTDEGVIHAFRAAAAGIAPAAPQEPYRARVPVAREPAPLAAVPAEIRRGPIIRFTAPGAARITWSTATLTPTTLCYGIDSLDQRRHDAKPKREHEVRLSGLRQNVVYRIALVLPHETKERIVGPFECDTHLNFTLPPVDVQATAGESSAVERLADALVAHAGQRAGICLLAGQDTLPLATALASRTDFSVIVLDTDERQVTTAQRQLQSSGFYGTRITMLAVADLTALPTTSGFANLVVGSLSGLNASHAPLVKELARVMCPHTGKLFLRLPDSKNAAGQQALLRRWLPAATHPCTPWKEGFLISRSAEPGSGTWTHQYGRADNATFAGETLGGACRTTDFHVQWLGRPGPRFQSDRGNRKPAPLYEGGLLFVQGLDRVRAIDAHNGIALWQLEVPDSRRFNIRNDSANWCADEARLYLAVRDACWALDGRTGKLVAEYVVPAAQGPAAWGYVGREGQLLVGSRCRPRSAYQEFWGGQFWYADSDGPLAAKVISDALFAIDVRTGQKPWTYHGGAIVHTSITLTSECVIFAEGARQSGPDSETGRATAADFWTDLQLVALSLTDGRVLWRVPAEVGPANTMLSVACGQDIVIAVASAKGNYRVVARRARDGARLWSTNFPWEARDKGGDSARPAIVGDKLFISPNTFALKSGEPLPLKLMRGACGSYAATAHVFVTRLGNLGLWDPQARRATSWEQLRPDCWLSAIPAGGMILAPEGGGGCSCGGWIETSIAFAPQRPTSETAHSVDGRP